MKSLFKQIFGEQKVVTKNITNSKVTINGKTYAGRNVTIINNKVYVDGQDTTPDSKEISIRVEGDLENLKVDCCNKIEISGSVKGGASTTSGDITCGNVSGGIKTTSGDVECNDITGDVQTVSGDVDAQKINGKVSTLSGDIKYRK